MSRILRWSLLVLAVALLLAGLLGIVGVPRWVGWPWRLAAVGLVTERQDHVLSLPIVIAVACWLLRRERRGVCLAGAGCALVAAALLLRPTAQAWLIGRSLPAQLSAALGPANLERPPFSVGQLYAALPAHVPTKTGAYARDGQTLGFTFFRAIGRNSAPCVITLKGGAWFDGGYVDQRPFNHWLAQQGYAVATVGYSALPKARWSEPREDVLAAIALLRAHAAELGIDRDRFVLLGRSAGAQIALTTAYHAHDPGIRGVVAFYPPTDIASLWQRGAGGNSRIRGMTFLQVVELFLGGRPDQSPALYASASPLLVADRQSPPTLLLHGTADSLVPVTESRRLLAHLRELNRSCALVEIPWAEHSFDTIDFNSPGAQLTTYAVAHFLAVATK